YIKQGKALGGRSSMVERFFEKPSLERARKYLETGGYLWNSGMFAWRASVILESFKSFLPQMAEGLGRIRTLLEGQGWEKAAPQIGEIFAAFESISA
ncbi:MAG: mannose-1-phosphate guanylyltransferase, partial [Proteobacteria bacterium]|nr:mannose-1-phosphate guanylyltransferase [Pseudomonadota bacterium]